MKVRVPAPPFALVKKKSDVFCIACSEYQEKNIMSDGRYTEPSGMGVERKIQETISRGIFKHLCEFF